MNAISDHRCAKFFREQFFRALNGFDQPQTRKRSSCDSMTCAYKASTLRRRKSYPTRLLDFSSLLALASCLTPPIPRRPSARKEHINSEPDVCSFPNASPRAVAQSSLFRSTFTKGMSPRKRRSLKLIVVSLLLFMARLSLTSPSEAALTVATKHGLDPWSRNALFLYFACFVS